MAVDCRECGKKFGHFDEDRLFVARMEMPLPASCPDCRQQRRLAHLNHYHLFRGTCAATGKPVVMHYPPGSPFRVIEQAHWHSDAVDNREFGRQFDFTRPFFEQFAELQQDVPRPALFTDYTRDENSEFTNFAGRNKDCYLIFDSDENRDCLYSTGLNSSTNTLDCYRAEGIELGYELIDCQKCYRSAFLMNCSGCSDSYFLANCTGCRSCAFCSNLKQKTFHIYNEPVSEEAYRAFVGRFRSHRALSESRTAFHEFRGQFLQRAVRGQRNEDVVGNYLTDSKKAFWAFDCRSVWDVRYCYQAFMQVKDSMDCNEGGEVELAYNSTTVGYGAYHIRCSMMSLSQLQCLTYCALCFHGCAHLFGCIGLKRQQFAILNLPYSEQEYRRLSGQIVEHMKETGEWGEFFPASLSTVPYNLSLAQQFFPLTPEESARRGLRWLELPVSVDQASCTPVPDSIDDFALDESHITQCEGCSKPFKLLPAELRAYADLGISAPRSCFLCRNTARHKLRAPRRLVERRCDSCGTMVMTALTETMAAHVGCERCYLESLE